VVAVFHQFFSNEKIVIIIHQSNDYGPLLTNCFSCSKTLFGNKETPPEREREKDKKEKE
jgi:hypothetical protein